MTPRAANPINRFAIGDRDPLKYNADGSLDIYIQPESPSEDKVSNWLPSSKGHPAISLKVYAPKLEALDSRWAPLAIKRAR